ncbi:MAG TPA: alginate lyase family protein, partial [Lacipirellulaceae bacterium]|nr:alginate lyase family protein [Lacipirellulaceae bacterium]
MMPSLTPVNAILVGAALLAGPLHAEVELSGVYYYEPARLVQVRDALARGAADAEIRAAAEMLREEADDALRRGRYAVMDKQGTAPGGDKHDYVSYGVYWWPNPDTADGLPYIRRDGETNHELRAQGDRDRLSKMIDDVETLALGHYLLGRSD